MMEAYEEQRRQRMEENRLRMKALQGISESFMATITPKPSPAKPKAARRPVDLSAVRRSGRVKAGPAPNYKEDVFEPLGFLRRSYKRKDLLNRQYAGDKERANAIEQAQILQETLDPKFPSFIKPMLQSHVTGGFWLGLPHHFCKDHLPKHDEEIILEDEDGVKSSTKYLSDKNGLSAGWRGFAIDHNLVDGDALVFQLLAPTKFKVHIIRCGSGDGEEAADVTNLGNSAKRIRARKDK